MPGKHCIPGATSVEDRQYQHVKASELSSGRPLKAARWIAAATVEKGRSERGETDRSRLSLGDRRHWRPD